MYIFILQARHPPRIKCKLFINKNNYLKFNKLHQTTKSYTGIKYFTFFTLSILFLIAIQNTFVSLKGVIIIQLFMKKNYKALLGLAVLLSPIVAHAQSDSKGDKHFYPYNYVQVQGGGSLLFTPGGRSDLLSPAFGLSIGRQFSSAIGARRTFRIGYKSKKRTRF